MTRLFAPQTPIYVGNLIRPAAYSDILILTRTRSHIEELKAGLRSCIIFRLQCQRCRPPIDVPRNSRYYSFITHIKQST